MTRAEELNEHGHELSDRGDTNGAVAAYRAAIEADGTWSVPWYNLGLLYKYEGAWSSSAECNREALRRDDGDPAAWWNLGIAATALGDWPSAREAWQRCGMAIPPGEGPVEMRLGPVPIRLNPGGRGEVVWSERIDPARAVIRNIPLPESGYYYGDLLLHDGAAEGSRTFRGREVPVFNALERLRRSRYHTYILDLPQSTREQRTVLSVVAQESGSCAEDWSDSIAFLCRSCSHGIRHEEHDAHMRAERPEFAVAAAARDEAEVAELIERWRERSGYGGYAGLGTRGGE